MAKWIIKTCIVLNLLDAQVFEGMTLFTPTTLDGDTLFKTFLVDNNFNQVNVWLHSRGAAGTPYLLEDSTLVYIYRVENPTMLSGGVGGGFIKYSWDGDILWQFELSDQMYQHHHDIQPLPNGNILAIVWERKTYQDALNAGKLLIDNPLNEIWSEAILELEPIYNNNASIVWEWHLWDHLVQDVDSSLSNFGNIEESPERLDVNYLNFELPNLNRPTGANGDWMHFNAIDYNNNLDQIVISSRNSDEIYIIDHSTSSSEAASSFGGNSGKGGDFLYRWGNPSIYGRGDLNNHLLKNPHGVNWIPSGMLGEGNLIIFNNDYSSSSAIFEINTPISEIGNYFISNIEPFGPEVPAWIYNNDFHSEIQGGAYRLPNGNTIITDSDDATIFEISPSNEIVWNFTYSQQESFIIRAQKYSFEYLDNYFYYNIQGDVDYNRNNDINDVLLMVDFLFHDIISNDLADFDQNGMFNLEDIESLLDFILSY